MIHTDILSLLGSAGFNESNFNFNENTSNISEKKEKKKNEFLYTNLYTSLIESLSNEKSDTDKSCMRYYYPDPEDFVSKNLPCINLLYL